LNRKIGEIGKVEFGRFPIFPIFLFHAPGSSPNEH